MQNDAIIELRAERLSDAISTLWKGVDQGKEVPDPHSRAANLCSAVLVVSEVAEYSQRRSILQKAVGTPY